LAIIVVVGLVITFATGSPLPFVGLLVLIPVASLGLGTVNTLSTAFRGKPVVYDVKIMPTDNPPSVPRSSPDGFCTECGAALGAGAQFCARCGTRRTLAAGI